MKYQLPKTFTARQLDRPGKLALHLRPGTLIELSAEDFELVKLEAPDIARRTVARPVKRRAVRIFKSVEVQSISFVDKAPSGHEMIVSKPLAKITPRQIPKSEAKE